MNDHERPVHVKDYDPGLGTNNCCTISGALLYDHPYTGRKYHIVIHQAFEIPYLKHHLLCAIQVHTNGVMVNDCPKFLTDHLTEETNFIIADDEWGNKVDLTLCLYGVTSYLPINFFD